MSATWTNEVRMVGYDLGRPMDEAASLMVRIGSVQGSFTGWWRGTWLGFDGCELAATDGQYPSHKGAVLAAASALANHT